MFFFTTYPNTQDAEAAGKEDEVTEEKPEDPNHRQFDVDELKVLTGPTQQIPALKNKACRDT